MSLNLQIARIFTSPSPSSVSSPSHTHTHTHTHSCKHTQALQMHPPPPPLMQDSLLNARLESKSSQTRQVLPGLLLCAGPVLRFPGGLDGRQIRLAELLEERRLRQITNPGFSSFSVSSLDSWQQACVVSLRGDPAWGCYGDMTLRLAELLGPRYRLANLSKGSALRCYLPYLHALFLHNFFFS